MKPVVSGKRRGYQSGTGIRDSGIRDSESGATLLELLVALAILTSALVIFIAALSTGAFAVRASDRMTTATNLAASQLESIKAATYITGTAAYAAIPSGSYAITQQISYWDGAVFTSNPLTDSGMQQITVTISYQSETLVTVANYKVNR